jgi:hypothetical protein
MVYPAGLEGKFYLAEKGRPGLHLIDATAEEVLDFVKARKPRKIQTLEMKVKCIPEEDNRGSGCRKLNGNLRRN